MLQRLVGEHVELDTALATDLHAVRADRSQLEQVLVNLVVNARDAMPRGGSHRRSRPRTFDLAEDAIERTLVKPGPYVLLAVSDTGVGIAEAIAAAHLRAVLHDQGAGQGHRARTGDRLRDRHAGRRLHLGLQRARSRNDVQGLFAGSGWRSRR